MAGQRRFQYHQRTKDDIKERANNRGGNFDSIFKSSFKVYKVREGKNVLRILPPTWEKPKHYGYDIWVNYGIGADNQSYLSLAKMKGQKDPIAEARIIASRDGDDNLARALQARQRILMWVIDRNAEDEGPQLWPAAFTVDKDLAAMSFDEDTKEVSYIDDPDNGRDFRFYKEGEGLKTKYPAAKMKLLTGSPLHEDPELAAEWLDFVAANPLPDVLNFYDYEHIAAMFDGQARVEDDGEETKAIGPRRPPKIVEPNEENEEVTPAPRPRIRPAVREPEPEPEEPKPAAGMSIRERLAARHKPAPKSVEDEDD